VNCPFSVQFYGVTTPVTFTPITCLSNCTQINTGTGGYSGSGTGYGAQILYPPISYRREVQSMRVYYLIKGLRVVSHNVSSGTKLHYVTVSSYPLYTLYTSPTVSVPANGYHEFVIPTIYTWIDHSAANRVSNVGWMVTKSGVSGTVDFTYSVDEVVISSQPIEFSLLDDASVVNLAECEDPDACRTGGTVHNAVGSGGDPINTRTGAFSYTNPDLSMPTTAGELVFQRSYSSATVTQPANSLAPGWVHNHAAKLIFSGDPGGKSGFVIFRGVEGNDYLFKDNGNNTYTAGPGVTATSHGTAGRR